MGAAKLITNVDPATDTLTSVAHGLNTGDGFLAIFTPDAAGVIPAGLAAVTSYWLIRTGADTFKLATSSVNAFLGTAIDITTAGAGALYLMQGLPYRVPMLAAVGAEVKSANDNAAWAAIVDLWNVLTAQASSSFPFGLALAEPAEAVVRPLLQFRDYKGHARTHIDHNGMRGGQVSEWEEHWKGTAIGAEWSFDTGGGDGAVSIADPDANFNQRGLVITTAVAAGTPTKLTSNYLNRIDNDSLVTLEATIRTPASIAAGDPWDLGLIFSNGGAGNSRFDLYFSNASANWRARWMAAAVVVTNTDTGVAVVAATNYRLKLELAGSNNTSQAANTMQARFFLNGALVATINVAAWASDVAKLAFGGLGTPTAIYAWKLGRIRYQWNHLLSSDAV